MMAAIAGDPTDGFDFYLLRPRGGLGKRDVESFGNARRAFLDAIPMTKQKSIAA
jgi:hypothetical protein